MALSVGWGVAAWVGSFFMSHYLTPLGVNFLLLPGGVRLRYWTCDWKVASSSSGRSTIRQQPWASCSHTRAPLSPSSKFGIGQGAVMPCGWEGNRRSGVALAMRHRLPWFIHLRAHGLRKGDEPRAYMRDGTLYPYLYQRFGEESLHSFICIDTNCFNAGIAPSLSSSPTAVWEVGWVGWAAAAQCNSDRFHANHWRIAGDIISTTN